MRGAQEGQVTGSPTSVPAPGFGLATFRRGAACAGAAGVRGFACGLGDAGRPVHGEFRHHGAGCLPAGGLDRRPHQSPPAPYLPVQPSPHLWRRSAPSTRRHSSLHREWSGRTRPGRPAGRSTGCRRTGGSHRTRSHARGTVGSARPAPARGRCRSGRLPSAVDLQRRDPPQGGNHVWLGRNRCSCGARVRWPVNRGSGRWLIRR